MLVPRFSIRVLLAATTLAAFAAVVTSYAFRGQSWAIAVTIMMASLLVVFSIHAALFLLARAVAQCWRNRNPAASLEFLDRADESVPPPTSAATDHEAE